MICTLCYEADMVTITKVFDSLPEIGEVEMEECPACGDITFTQDQANEVDRKRRIHTAIFLCG